MHLDTETRKLVVEALDRRARNIHLDVNTVADFVSEQTGDELSENTLGIICCDLLDRVALRWQVARAA